MEGFDLVMFKSVKFEERTGQKAAVFVVDKKMPSFTDLRNIEKVEGICCYFTTDGKEHDLPEKETEVVDEEVVTKKRRRKK